MADNFNLRTFLTENKLTKNAQLLNEARVDGFDVNKKAFEVSFINKYGGGDFRILNAETPEQAEEVFTDIFVNNPDFVQSIKSIEPYQAPAPKPQAEPQSGLEGVNYRSIEIDGVDSDDYPDFVDAYVISAEFEDGTPLSEEELEQLTDELYQSGELADMAAESLYENKKKPIMKETKLTAKERRLVEMVNSAMREEEEGNTFFRTDKDDQIPNPPAELHIPKELTSEDEMADETVIPEYNTIDELMNSIDHGTNKVAEEHKMQEMKKIAGMLREKARRMEESEHAAHISPRDLKQLATDAAKLEKAAEKLKAAFDKKFNKKEKPASTPKAEKVEALQEGTFDLRKFLTENKLTTNSRLIEEAGNTASGYERLHAKVDNLDRNIQVNAYQLLDFVNNLGGNVEDDMVIDAIFYTAQDNNADELISILADTMGMGGGSNDPLAFDGVFTYSDIQQALNGNEMDDNLKNQILDNDLIRHLERG